LITCECTDPEKVRFTAHLLEGPTAMWWETYQVTHPVEGLDWDTFRKGFRNAHISTGSRWHPPGSGPGLAPPYPHSAFYSPPPPIPIPAVRYKLSSDTHPAGFAKPNGYLPGVRLCSGVAA
jgi:hypothetical protein